MLLHLKQQKSNNVHFMTWASSIRSRAVWNSLKLTACHASRKGASVVVILLRISHFVNPTSAASTAREHVEVLWNNKALRERSTFFHWLTLSVDLLFVRQLPGTEAAGGTTPTCPPGVMSAVRNSRSPSSIHLGSSSHCCCRGTERNYIY